MDSSMPMILPKGFVRNSDEIYQEVAKYPIIPPEKTREYWLGMLMSPASALVGFVW
jgi:hypothetical protein